MTIEEYVTELQDDLKKKWEVFSSLWNDPTHADYENAKFEWQLANTKYREFTIKLLSHPHADIKGNIDDINWN
jgi:hypothetical protein